MYGYKISFEGPPNPLWGCETTITNYNWEDRRSRNVLEISITRAEYIVKVINKEKFVFKNTRHLSCSTPNNASFNSYSHPETEISITTIAIYFKKLNSVLKDLTAEDCNDQNTLLLPAFTEELSDAELDEFNILIHKYIMYNEGISEHDKLMCYSILYDILSKLDAFTRKHLTQNTNQTYNHYVKKVNQIIQERYNTKLTKYSIAKELGISNGYLTKLYKKSTGKTVSEYLLMFRMRKAEELLKNINMSTAKIAAAVGFDDEHYFRKKFKQYFGMNIREYKGIKHGNTLYHDKPTKQS